MKQSALYEVARDEWRASKDVSAESRYQRKFMGVIRCTGVNQEDDDDAIVSVIKFKHSNYEDELKLKLAITGEGAGLSRIFKVNEQYSLYLREAPTAPNGMTTNLKLDGEIVSIIVENTQIGMGKRTRKEGDAIALLGFGLYETEDAPAAGVIGTKLFIRAEGVHHNGRFELENAYRLSVSPAPNWVRQAEAEKEPKDFKDTPLGQTVESEGEEDGWTACHQVIELVDAETRILRGIIEPRETDKFDAIAELALEVQNEEGECGAFKKFYVASDDMEAVRAILFPDGVPGGDPDGQEGAETAEVTVKKAAPRKKAGKASKASDDDSDSDT